MIAPLQVDEVQHPVVSRTHRRVALDAECVSGSALSPMMRLFTSRTMAMATTITARRRDAPRIVEHGDCRSPVTAARSSEDQSRSAAMSSPATTINSLWRVCGTIARMCGFPPLADYVEARPQGERLGTMLNTSMRSRPTGRATLRRSGGDGSFVTENNPPTENSISATSIDQKYITRPFPGGGRQLAGRADCLTPSAAAPGSRIGEGMYGLASIARPTRSSVAPPLARAMPGWQRARRGWPVPSRGLVRPWLSVLDPGHEPF